MRNAQSIWSFLIVAVITATVVLVWTNLHTYLTADHEVVIAREAQRRLYELTLVLEDAENGARGFIITAEPRHAQIFEKAAQELDSRLQSAHNAIAGIGREQAFVSITSLVAQRMELLRQTRMLTAAGNTGQAAEVLKAESADRISLAFRQEIVALVEFTNSVLEQRLATCRQSMMGMTRWVAIGLLALTLSGAGLLWCIIRDAQQQRRIAIELTRARDGALEGARARDDFLNVLSHELRTPLTPALLSVSGMEKRSSVSPEQRQELTMVRRQLELEARIIDDLLDVSRILRGDVVLRSERVSIHTLLKHACDMLREDMEDGELNLTCALEASNDVVMGSESRLHQVFWHLLANAIKFTPAKGSIRVSTSNEGSKIVIAITDTGVGMSEHQLPTIFEAFASARSSRTRIFGGLGVGLAIVKSVVEMHSGKVTVESEGKDRGATFRVELPTAGSSA